MTKRQLILEDGTIFIGEGFGGNVNTTGEIVFNTSMTGYQEIISDPSYCGQIITMTYPLIGNYGINRDDFETVTPFIHGFIVKEVCDSPSNFRSDETLHEYLKVNDIPGISGIDTRKLTKVIRKHGTMRAMITDADDLGEEMVREVRNSPFQTVPVKQTSAAKPYVVPGRGLRIVLVDFGMKHGILRELTKRDCHVTVVPYNYGAENILRLKPDGILLTNGPGDPKNIPESIEMVKQVLGELPLFGVCLGHQLLALACGADTEKMRFGHRGGYHPVKDLRNNKTYMTSQNHGYVVTRDSLEHSDLTLTQIALNDGSIEGISHNVFPAFSVQYYPEGSPGSGDRNSLYDEFLQLIINSKSNSEVVEHA